MTKQDKVQDVKKLADEIISMANYIILIGEEIEIVNRPPLEILNEAILYYIDKQNSRAILDEEINY